VLLVIWNRLDLARRDVSLRFFFAVSFSFFHCHFLHDLLMVHLNDTDSLTSKFFCITLIHCITVQEETDVIRSLDLLYRRVEVQLFSIKRSLFSIFVKLLALATKVLWLYNVKSLL
jgi:hypothetical protein